MEGIWKSCTVPKDTEDLQDYREETLQYMESLTPGRAYNNLDQSSALRSGYQHGLNFGESIFRKWRLEK
ncbi:hypothetical protein BDA96_04G049400 [Sorghum bicolor]|uniref:Uncharacterized protein n=1 Tax=Sorghum bicolor TaxID=4558 RepID=A0A921R1R3_SORBI|nr:hypothetical protein BDA96_04G049400 [Sorghum bicolor]